MKILVTGGLGFIGSNFIKKSILKKNIVILNLDKKSNFSVPESLYEINKHKNYFYKKVDLLDKKKIEKLVLSFLPDYIIHFAAESHVDRSISDPTNFVKSNIIGTLNLLESAKKLFSIKKNLKKFIHISTDEVYGSLKKNDKSFEEKNKYFPNYW